MVLNANDVQNWKDFPKGLRVLLLNGDADSSTELRSKLEQMDYLVHTFHNEKEALSAIASESESFFHIAIVEVSTSNCDASFWFLENVKDLPTIMTSNIHCLSTMMKCISLGAVEFMNKPLSEDKLRNIWQHVVHKAFNARESTPNNSQLIITESVPSALPLLEEDDNKAKVSIKTENISPMEESDNKYPAPSTPQLEQGARLLDDGDCCQDQTNYPIEKEGMMAIDGESKFVENTCRNALNKDTLHIGEPQSPEKSMVRVEQEYCTNGSKKVSSGSNEEGTNGDADGDAENIANKALGLANSGGARANRKKMKVDWTPNLHKKFVKAVEQLGVDQAIPSRILELMNVEGLTRHNVASHLQKYRMQKRHILPREDGSRLWQHQRDHTMERRTSYYPPLKPIMAYPPYHSSSHAMPVHNFAYPVWGQPNGRQNGVQIWGPPPCYPPWQPPESEQWNSYVGMNADTWGCPVMPPSLHNPYYSYPQSVSGTHNNFASENNYGMRQSSFDLQLAEEIIDKVVKEAMNKPWLPLPLGLKPPSTDSVLSELTKQGISTIPPHINGYKFH